MSSKKIIKNKEIKGSRNQADEPEITTRSNTNINEQLFKSFYAQDRSKRGWVGEIRQTRLLKKRKLDEQVTTRSSGFKTQRELGVPDPALIPTADKSNNKNPLKNYQKFFSIKLFPPLAFLIFLISSFSLIAFAIPNSLTLQGKLTTLAGASVSGTNNFTFAIYDNITNLSTQMLLNSKAVLLST